MIVPDVVKLASIPDPYYSRMLKALKRVSNFKWPGYDIELPDGK